MYESKEFSVKNGDKCYIRVEKNDILRIQNATCHASYPYSFLKVMLKNGDSYLFAMNGTISAFLNSIRGIGFKSVNIPEEGYVSALRLVESVRSKPLAPSSPLQPTNSTKDINIPVDYLWVASSEEQNYIQLVKGRLSLSPETIDIVDEIGSNIQIQINQLESIFHEESSEVLPYTVMKLVLKSGDSYLACLNGCVIPILASLSHICILSLS